MLLENIAKHKEFYQKKKLTVNIYFSGGLKEKMIDYARKQGIDELITFGERLLEYELAEAFQKSRVVVLPSTKESLGLVGIEAIACGAILVGSDSGGIREYLVDGKNGFLFRDGETDDLHRAIEKALNSFDEFNKQQPTVSESVSKFSLESAMDETVALFKKTLQK